MSNKAQTDNRKLILASSSAYRQGLLARVATEFECISPNIDESRHDNEQPKELAKRLARGKALTIANEHPHATVIGSDQVPSCNSRILGKPGNHQKAVEQLLAASGQTVTFLTAVCILDPVNRSRYEHIDKTTVRFRQFDRRLAESYLRHDQPYDCAGSFKIEGAGFVLFESVKTDDPTALIGLPMIWVSDVLLELGYLIP